MSLRHITAILALAVIITVSIVYASCIYVTGRVGFSTGNINKTVYFLVNFPSGACIVKVTYSLEVVIAEKLLNATRVYSPYFVNITLDNTHITDLGVWIFGANMSILQLTDSGITVLLWRKSISIRFRYVRSPIHEILTRNITFAIFYLPKIEWGKVYVYYNGEPLPYTSNCDNVFMPVPGNVYCFDKEDHIVALRIVLDSESALVKITRQKQGIPHEIVVLVVILLILLLAVSIIDMILLHYRRRTREIHVSINL